MDQMHDLLPSSSETSGSCCDQPILEMRRVRLKEMKPFARPHLGLRSSSYSASPLSCVTLKLAGCTG